MTDWSIHYMHTTLFLKLVTIVAMNPVMLVSGCLCSEGDEMNV